MCEIPFEKTDRGALPTKVLGKLNSRETNLIFHGCVGIQCNDDFAVLPCDPIQVENRPFHIQALAIGCGCFADRAAPIENAGDADWQKARIVLYAELCQPPKCQSLELALGDDSTADLRYPAACHHSLEEGKACRCGLADSDAFCLAGAGVIVVGFLVRVGFDISHSPKSSSGSSLPSRRLGSGEGGNGVSPTGNNRC